MFGGSSAQAPPTQRRCARELLLWDCLECGSCSAIVALHGSSTLTRRVNRKTNQSASLTCSPTSRPVLRCCCLQSFLGCLSAGCMAGQEGVRGGRLPLDAHLLAILYMILWRSVSSQGHGVVTAHASHRCPDCYNTPRLTTDASTLCDQWLRGYGGSLSPDSACFGPSFRVRVAAQYRPHQLQHFHGPNPSLIPRLWAGMSEPLTDLIYSRQFKEHAPQTAPNL